MQTGHLQLRSCAVLFSQKRGAGLKDSRAQSHKKKYCNVMLCWHGNREILVMVMPRLVLRHSRALPEGLGRFPFASPV